VFYSYIKKNLTKSGIKFVDGNSPAFLGRKQLAQLLARKAGDLFFYDKILYNMKIYGCFIWLSALILGLPDARSEEQIEFFTGTVQSAKEKAKTENKLYFIEFYARWCEPCKWMDENTFSEPTLSQYVAKHYVPVKVDVENMDGYVWKQKYKVQYLPTIIVLNGDGHVLGKYEKSLTAADMLRLLQNHRGNPVSAESEWLASESNTEPAAPVITNQNSEAKPVFVTVHKEPGMPTAKDIAKKPSSANSALTLPASTNPTVAKKPKANPSTNGNEYRIQTGVFSDVINATSEVNKLQKQFAKSTVQIFSKKNTETNTVIYRVTVGKFTSREEAASFVQTMKAQGVNGVIKHATELK
jgi:thiol-disulfide isomerase/thioredoxin